MKPTPLRLLRCILLFTLFVSDTQPISAQMAAKMPINTSKAYTMAYLPLFVQILLVPSHNRITAGGTHTCGLTAFDQVKCWGENTYGELGDGTHINHWTPVDVVSTTGGMITIAAGEQRTCGVTTTGAAKCWGSNGYGELGDGTTTDRDTPVDVVGMNSGVASIDTSDGYTCGITSTGGMKCWGKNSYGQLGDGTTTDRLIPVDVIGLDSGVIAITAGAFHTCALTTAGGVKCWGANAYGELGDGTTADSLTPVNVAGLTSNVIAVTAEWEHTCALTAKGGVKCWGWNSRGQLGDGTTTDRWMPVDVVGLTSGVKAISAGAYHTCALTDTGGVKCWGDNYAGQLGDGTIIPRLTPVDVVGLTSGVVVIDAGFEYNCALTSAGGVMCWGSNWAGALGDGTTIDRWTPVDVVGWFGNLLKPLPDQP